MDSIFFMVRALVVLGSSLVGIAIGSALGAIFLRLAAAWLRFGDIPYLTAYKGTFTSGFVLCVLHFMIGFNHEITRAFLVRPSSEGPFGARDLMYASELDHTYAFGPGFVFYSFVFSLVITALIFCRTLHRHGRGPRMTFGESLALASVYYSLGFVFVLVIGLMIYGIVGALVSVGIQ